jgi:DNA-binding GntR family transcriptional regulator
MSTLTKVDTIIDGIRSRILSGEFGEEGRLPSFRKLVDEYQTSQETMNKAMQALQAEGLLLSAGAKGVFVNSSRIRMPGIVVDFSEYLEKQGLKPKSELLNKPEIITPSVDIQRRLKLKKEQEVLFRQRKQGTERTPFRIAFEYFPLQFINEKMLDQISKDPSMNVLEAIEKNFGKAIGYTQEELIVRLPTSFEQEHLQIVRTNPVIESQRNHLTKDKKTVLLYNKKVLNANHFLLSYDYTADQWR